MTLAEIAAQQMLSAKAMLTSAAAAALRGEVDEQAVQDALAAVELARRELARCQDIAA